MAGAQPWDSRALEDAAEKESAGEELMHYLMDMYASGKEMNANHVCAISHFAKKAGASGQKLRRVALAPGHHSGNYAKRLERHYPHLTKDHFYWIDVPLHNEQGRRESKRIPIIPVHEALNREVLADPDLDPAVLAVREESKQWYKQYQLGFAIATPEPPGHHSQIGNEQIDETNRVLVSFVLLLFVVLFLSILPCSFSKNRKENMHPCPE